MYLLLIPRHNFSHIHIMVHKSPKGWEYGQRPNSQYYRFGRAAIIAGLRHSANLAMHRFVSKTSSSTSTQGDTEAALKTLQANNEYGEGRRAPTFTTRLHAARYVQCDPLFKDLFFPILNMCRNFGFCSVTGIGKVTAGVIGDGNTGGGTVPAPLEPNHPMAFSKANGTYRGIACFTIRSDKMDRFDEFKLCPLPVVAGGTSLTSTATSLVTSSAYKRFCNGPQLSGNLSSGGIPGYGVATAQEFQWAGPDDGEAAFNQTKASISEIGNLSDIETAAVQSVNFAHAIGKSTDSSSVTPGASVGTTSVAVRSGTPGAVNWDGTGSVKNTTGGYYANLRNTTIRIADGVLEMDVSNGKNTSCVIELVIHSQTKQESDFTPQAFFNQVYQSCEFQQNQARIDGPTPTSNTALSAVAPGGWQAFYDPEYPLLSLKSSHAKKAHDMYKEVHRSSHILSPGMSKTLKVYLGSHYYSLGNKTLDQDGTRMQPKWTAFPSGNLLVSVGHTGVSQLTMPCTSDRTRMNNLPDQDNSGTHNVPGAGFWLGKQRAPSEIVVEGSYKEKFYPAYVISDNRVNYDDYTMRPPTITDLTYGLCTLPSGSIIQNTVATVDASDNPVSAKVATGPGIGEL